MPDRSIILKAWEVRGLLEGRISMLLRVVVPQPLGTLSSIKLCGTQEKWRAQYGWQTADGKRYEWRCPFGSPGDLLWCKETWCRWQGKPYYRADGEHQYCGAAESLTKDGECQVFTDGYYFYGNWQPASRWKSSTHMPRWASRLFRTTQAVRVLRVQELSAYDALCCGIDLPIPPNCEPHPPPDRADKWSEEQKEHWIEGAARGLYFCRLADAQNHIDALHDQHDQDNPKHKWDTNPWCWLGTTEVKNP